MTRLLAIAILLGGIVQAQDYSHLYSGTDVQLPGPAPFKASDPINTCVTLPDLSHAKMCRVTGPELSSLCPISFVATQSGGSQDIISNTDGTKMLVTCDGVSYVLGFNPQTLQVTNPSPSKIVNKCIGNPAWSRVNPNLLYCRVQGESVVQAMTIMDVTLPATVATAFDFASCPQAPTGKVATGSVLGVGEYDQLFTANLSWTGVQDSARYEFAYSPTLGCSTLDTQSPGGARVYIQPSGSPVTSGYPAMNALTWEPVASNWFIHDSQSNGIWVQFTMANCVGADCGQGDSGAIWLAGTTTLEILQEAPVSSGHGGLGVDLVYNMGNPNMVARHITDLEHRWNAFTYPNCCQDHHPSFSHRSDSDAIIDVTGGPFIIQQPGAYYSEVVVWQNGIALRPGHTYSSGTPAAGFEGEYGIGAPNQPRTVQYVTSDMLGALGTIVEGGKTFNRADVFALGLVGQ